MPNLRPGQRVRLLANIGIYEKGTIGRVADRTFQYGSSFVRVQLGNDVLFMNAGQVEAIPEDPPKIVETQLPLPFPLPE